MPDEKYRLIEREIDRDGEGKGERERKERKRTCLSYGL